MQNKKLCYSSKTFLSSLSLHFVWSIILIYHPNSNYAVWAWGTGSIKPECVYFLNMNMLLNLSLVNPAGVTSGHFRMSQNESWIWWVTKAIQKKHPPYPPPHTIIILVSQYLTYFCGKMCRIDVSDTPLPAEHTLLSSNSCYDFLHLLTHCQRVQGHNC